MDKQAAKETLETEWSYVLDNPDENPLDATKYEREIRQIKEVVTGSQLTYKYILLTAALAKAVNPVVHYRALQMGSKLSGSYDARSLCHTVIVPFEKSHGERFGGSNEPFLNRPARYPEFDLSNRDRNRNAQKRLFYVLDNAQNFTGQDREFPKAFLRQTLKAMHGCSPTKVKFEFAEVETSLQATIDIVKEFLSVSGSGERLVAVSAAVFESMYGESNKMWQIKAYPVNWPDRFAKTAGDIEFYFNGKLMKATESKDKPLSESDVRHCSDKAKRHGVSEYMILVGAGVIQNHKRDIEKYIKTQLEDGINLYLLEVPQQFFPYFVYLGNKGRSVFLKKVGEYLNIIKAKMSNKREWARLLRKYSL